MTRAGRGAGILGSMSPTPRQPRRSVRDARKLSARAAAYRRLALAIVGLDVPTLAAELQAARCGPRTVRLLRAA
jgi:hypothetical protein